MALDSANSGCVDSSTIEVCVDLNGNVDPEFLHFYSAGSPDTRFYTSDNYTLNCANSTGLDPGTQYNFTASAEKFDIEGDKFAYFQLCTCKAYSITQSRPEF